MSKLYQVITTSVADGKYFGVSTVEEGNVSPMSESAVINVFDEVKYQEILGFGGAFTESAAYNYALMSEKNKELVRKAYFSKEEGIAYNFGRTHINSCDFSLAPYTYVKDGDKTLETFDIAPDKKYITPFLRDAIRESGEGITLFASPWSPPGYMKDTGNMLEGGKLLPAYKKTWAHYYAKYIKAMAAEGVKIDAISIQNEPIATQPWESCTYTPEEEAEFTRKYLIPALDEEGLSHVKIIIWDHNKERVYDRARDILRSRTLKRRVWAVGHHWYSGQHFDGLKLVYEVLKKPVICTEFCCSIHTPPLQVAEEYGREICENLNNYMIASCDWNLILDQNGGPSHNRFRGEDGKPAAEFDPKDVGCYAPILYNTETDTVELTPAYYYIGHFSKYVKRGARRIATTKCSEDLRAMAFENPNGEKVLVVMNECDKPRAAIVRYRGKCTETVVPAHGIETVLF